MTKVNKHDRGKCNIDQQSLELPVSIRLLLSVVEEEEEVMKGVGWEAELPALICPSSPALTVFCQLDIKCVLIFLWTASSFPRRAN